MGIVWEAYHKRGSHYSGYLNIPLNFVSVIWNQVGELSFWGVCLSIYKLTPKSCCLSTFGNNRKPNDNGQRMGQRRVVTSGESPWNPDFSPPDLQAEVEDNYKGWTTDHTDPPSPDMTTNWRMVTSLPPWVARVDPQVPVLFFSI